jgi:small subunit ribosomal protein S11
MSKETEIKEKKVEDTQPNLTETQSVDKQPSPQENQHNLKTDLPSSGSATAQDILKDDIKDITIRRAKGSKNVTNGTVHILATFNNTKVSFSDKQGNVIAWSNAGKCGFRGSRKSTAYAAQVVTQDAGRKAMSHGLKEVDIRLNGPGMGRDSAVRTLQSLGFIVNSILDVTPVPHNGCRPKKRRRV